MRWASIRRTLEIRVFVPRIEKETNSADYGFFSVGKSKHGMEAVYFSGMVAPDTDNYRTYILWRQGSMGQCIESQEPGTPAPALLKGGEEKSPYPPIVSPRSKMCLTPALRSPYQCLTILDAFY
jgi:hypothetical protein